MKPLSRVEIRYDLDVVRCRQRARLAAELLGFDRQDQTRISTAVSEVARNALLHGRGGEAEFGVDLAPPRPALTVVVRDQGPGIAEPDAVLAGHAAGQVTGLVGSQRLLDTLQIDSRPGAGTCVTLVKWLPADAGPVTPERAQDIALSLASQHVDSPLDDMRSQNQALLAALELVQQRDSELMRVNQELIDTNTGIVALYTDLEDKSQQLQLAEQVLRLRNADLKAFAYTVSHDLKAPLRGIAGYAEELVRKHAAALSERAGFCVGQILGAARNLDRLIEDLLSFARLDTEPVVYGDVDLRALVVTILQDRSLDIAERGVQVTVRLPRATLHSWETGLKQVMANLIDNALKFSRHATPARVTIRAEEQASQWQIVVSDNGIGFDPQHHDRMFLLFNRLVRAEAFEGTGAGLAIVKKVVDTLGGSIQATGAPGQGALFSVTLPKLAAVAATP